MVKREQKDAHFGLLPTDSRPMPKLGVRMAVRDIFFKNCRNWDVQSDISCRGKVPRSLHVKNSLRAVCDLLSEPIAFLSLSDILSLSSNSPNILDLTFIPHGLYYRTYQYLLYLLLNCSHPEHTCNTCYWTFSKHLLFHLYLVYTSRY